MKQRDPMNDAIRKAAGRTHRGLPGQHPQTEPAELTPEQQERIAYFMETTKCPYAEALALVRAHAASQAGAVAEAKRLTKVDMNSALRSAAGRRR